MASAQAGSKDVPSRMAATLTDRMSCKTPATTGNASPAHRVPSHYAKRGSGFLVKNGRPSRAA